MTEAELENLFVKSPVHAGGKDGLTREHPDLINIQPPHIRGLLHSVTCLISNPFNNSVRYTYDLCFTFKGTEAQKTQGHSAYK